MEELGFLGLLNDLGPYFEIIGQDLGNTEMNVILANMVQETGDIFPTIPIPVSQGKYRPNMGRYRFMSAVMNRYQPIFLSMVAEIRMEAKC